MAPTINQVLESGSSPITQNLFYLAALAAVGFVAALAAKGYTHYKRRSFLPQVLEASPSLDEMEIKKLEEKNEELNFMVDELREELDDWKMENEKLLNHNTQLGERLHENEDLKRNYDVLYRTNLTLAKECEKLKQERQELISKKASQPLPETKTSPAAKIKTKKKEAARKPKRVFKKRK